MTTKSGLFAAAAFGLLAAGWAIGSARGAEAQRVFKVHAMGYIGQVDQAWIDSMLEKSAAGNCEMATSHDGFVLTDKTCTDNNGPPKTRSCNAVANCTGANMPNDWKPGQGSRQ